MSHNLQDVVVNLEHDQEHVELFVSRGYVGKVQETVEEEAEEAEEAVHHQAPHGCPPR